MSDQKQPKETKPRMNGRKIGNEILKLYHTKPHAFFFRRDEFGPPTEDLKAKLRKSRDWFVINKARKPNHNETQHIRDYTIGFDETADGLFANVACHHYSSVKPNTIQNIAKGLPHSAPIDTKEVKKLADEMVQQVAEKEKQKAATNPNIEQTKSVNDILADFKRASIQRPAPQPQMDAPTIDLDLEEPITARNTSAESNDSGSDSSSGITEFELPKPARPPSPKLERSLTKPPPLQKQKAVALPVRVSHPSPERQQAADELEIEKEKARIEEERIKDEEKAIMKEKQILAELAAKLADRERRKARNKKEKKKNELLKKKLKAKDIDSDGESDAELDLLESSNWNPSDLFTVKNVGIAFGLLVGGNVALKVLFGSGRQASQPQLIQIPSQFAQQPGNF